MVEKVLQRSAENKPILDEATESFHFSQPKVALYFNPDKSEGTGSLYLTTKRVVWLDDADAAAGFSIPFRTIICHAIARGGTFEHFQSPSIYCQLESTDLYEARFVPEDSNALDTMFKAFSECASMNPDPIEEDEGDFFYDADEVAMNVDAAESAASRFDAGASSEQFEDAESGASNGHAEGEEGEDDDAMVHNAKLQRL
eukprot:TRINITY_DN10946_c0_g1_i1.p1 TRINITY_DN10946_c0_g1~~TRINITY_DN10946_c0_g1_i1.p1  ORF type:complete len:209 (+),score=47.22 TRINITY_DN10946_c0_g1_i1:28-627(+)